MLIDDGRTVRAFERFGVAEAGLEAKRDIVGQDVAPDRNRRGVNRAATGVDRNIGRAATYVEQHHADMLFFGEQRRGRGRERLEDEAGRFESGAVHALEHVGDEGVAAGDDVCVDFQARAGHPDRIADAFVSVNAKLTRQRVDDLPVGTDVDQLRRVDHAPHVAANDLAFLARDRHDAPVIRALDVLAGDSRHTRGRCARPPSVRRARSPPRWRERSPRGR